MTWEEVCDHPLLQGLPFKMELNKAGNIEMSPAKNRHGEYQFQIGHLLQLEKPDGICITETGVNTIENVKVPDVVWVSYERRRATPHEPAWASAPEIRVEIVSPSNSDEDQMHKGELYFIAGAEEFWLCDTRGNTQFFDADCALERSRLCPNFPARVEILE